VAVMAVLWVISWVIGTVMFLSKAALVVAVIAGVVSLIGRFKSS
jgi:hypothetical protein